MVQGLLKIGKDLLYSVNNRLKRLRVVHGQVGQNLAVEFNAVGVKLAHQLAVGHSLDACTSIDAGNPKGAKVALLGTTVTVGVTQGFFNGVFGDRPNIFTAAKVASGHF